MHRIVRLRDRRALINQALHLDGWVDGHDDVCWHPERQECALCTGQRGESSLSDLRANGGEGGGGGGWCGVWGWVSGGGGGSRGGGGKWHLGVPARQVAYRNGNDGDARTHGHFEGACHGRTRVAGCATHMHSESAKRSGKVSGGRVRSLERGNVSIAGRYSAHLA